MVSKSRFVQFLVLATGIVGALFIAALLVLGGTSLESVYAAERPVAVQPAGVRTAAPITPTIELSETADLQPGMIIAVHHYFPVTSSPGEVGQYTVDYTPGEIELLHRDDSFRDYWRVRVTAGGDTLIAFMWEPAVFEAALGHRVVRVKSYSFTLFLIRGNKVNVRAGAGTDQLIVGKIIDPAISYTIVDDRSIKPHLWYQVLNSQAGGWTTGWVAADYFYEVPRVRRSQIKVVRLNLAKTEGQAVRVRIVAGTTAPIVGRITSATATYETRGGVLLGSQLWHKILNSHYRQGDPNEGWFEGYVLSDFFIEEIRN